MIHVDVKPSTKGHTKTREFLIQTSVDGGPWKTHYIFTMTPYPQLITEEEAITNIKHEADAAARIFVAGMRFAGAEVRATSCGYGL